jgi:hypothetical protein
MTEPLKIFRCPECGEQVWGNGRGERLGGGRLGHCHDSFVKAEEVEVIPLSELTSERSVDALCAILDRDHDIQLTGWWTGHAILTALAARLSDRVGEER